MAAVMFYPSNGFCEGNQEMQRHVASMRKREGLQGKQPAVSSSDVYHMPGTVLGSRHKKKKGFVCCGYHSV